MKVSCYFCHVWMTDCYSSDCVFYYMFDLHVVAVLHVRKILNCEVYACALPLRSHGGVEMLLKVI